MRILYVEDNPANVFLVKRVAKMGNHEIINYIDGGQALKKFDEVNPHLVLMDIQLSGEKSGLDVVRELRERGVKTPIIAVTAYAMVGDKERCLEAGCDDYLAKPLPIPRLVEIFEEHNKRALASDSAATEVSGSAKQDTSTNTATTAESPSVAATTETPTTTEPKAEATTTPDSHTLATQPSIVLSDAKKAEMDQKETAAKSDKPDAPEATAAVDGNVPSVTPPEASSATTVPAPTEKPEIKTS